MLSTLTQYHTTATVFQTATRMTKLLNVTGNNWRQRPRKRDREAATVFQTATRMTKLLNVTGNNWRQRP